MADQQENTNSYLIASYIVNQEIERKALAQFLADKFGIDTVELEAYTTSYSLIDANKEYFAETVAKMAKTLKF